MSAQKETLKKVIAFIGRYRLLLLVSILLSALTVVLQLYVPILFGDAVDGIIAAGNVDMDLVVSCLKKILIVILVSSITTWIMNVLNNRLVYRVIKDIRAKAIRVIQTLPLKYLDSHSTGDIVGRMIADTDQLSDGLLLGVTQLFSGVVMIIVTLILTGPRYSETLGKRK